MDAPGFLFVLVAFWGYASASVTWCVEYCFVPVKVYCNLLLDL